MIEELEVKRVVIDALGDLIQASSDASRMHDYLYALNQHFSVNGLTSIYTYESPIDASGLIAGGMNSDGERFSYMSDAVILLNIDMKKPVKRTLSVVKQRASAHELGTREISITADGVKVL